MNIGLARFLGPEEYGNALLIINVILIFNVFMTNGLYQSLVQYSGNTAIDLRDLWRKAFVLQIATSAVLMAINLSIAWPLAQIFGEPQLLYPFLLLAIVIPANGLYYCQIGMLNGMHRFKQQATASVIYSLVRVVLIFGILLIFKMPLYAIILGTFVAYAIAYFYADSQWSYHTGTETVASRTLFMDAVRFIGLFIFITLFMNVDFFILKSLCDDKILIGQYGAMINVGKMIYFFVFSFTNTFYPVSLRLFGENNLGAIRSRLRDINSILIAFSFACIIGTYYFDAEIIQLLFGSEYVQGGSMLMLYCTAIILLSISVLYSHILSVFKSRRAPIYAFSIALAVFVGASVQLYPYLGLYSVLYSFIICQLLLFVFLAVLLRRYLSGYIPVRYLVVSSLIAGASIGLSLFADAPFSFLFRTLLSGVSIIAIAFSSRLLYSLFVKYFRHYILKR